MVRVCVALSGTARRHSCPQPLFSCDQDDTPLQLRLCQLRPEDSSALFRDMSTRQAVIDSFAAVVDCKWNPNAPDCLCMLSSKGVPACILFVTVEFMGRALSPRNAALFPELRS
jgi:hypothetical protein